MNTNHYYQILSVYESITDKESTAMDDTRSILSLFHESSGVARNITLSLYHQSGKSTRKVGAMTSTDVNNFIDDQDKRSRDIIVQELNDYIKYLEGFRKSGYKICALYSYLIFEGLIGILSDLYVPESLRIYFDRTVELLRDRSLTLIKEVNEYFTTKDNEELSIAINSLSHMILSQRTDQIISTLSSIYTFTDEDREFLTNKRYEYLKYNGELDRKIVLDSFEISDTSYYNNLKMIVNDLATRLSDENRELLTDLFLRR